MFVWLKSKKFVVPTGLLQWSGHEESGFWAILQKNSQIHCILHKEDGKNGYRKLLNRRL